MEKNIQNHSDIKETIIDATISLIESSGGLIENITMRAIAQKADVAVGLINYAMHNQRG
jgi:AcrR family transcriptional regulator